MQDGSSFVIGPGSHFVLHQYRLTEEMQVSQADVTITSGSVETHIAASPKTNFEIRTPVAKITAKSGEFWCGFSFSENNLDVVLLKSEEIMVKNDHGGRIISQPNTGTSVIGDSAPQAVKPWLAQRVLQALEETQL